MASAPSIIDLFLSGITRSGETSVIAPRPWQVGQAPNGELNENMRGSRLSNTISGWLGQAPHVLNVFSSWNCSTVGVVHFLVDSDFGVALLFEFVENLFVNAFHASNGWCKKNQCLAFFGHD